MADLEAFKEDVRAFIAEHLPQELRVGNRSDLPGEPLGRWVNALAERGWITPDWPTEYGGGGLDRKTTAALRAELKAVRAPIISSFGTSMLGPTLLEYGTEEQKKRHLIPISKHTTRWCQGFSEPGSGSDLASLQCRAERDGDEFVITGQKIWTTGAHRADWIFCLVRTDFDAPKHEGISFILFPMNQAGIEVAPLELIDGTAHFSQVFFDGARGSVDDLVGPANGGWTIAKRLLQHERGTDGSSEGGISGAAKETITEFVKRKVGMEDGVLADPTLRERLAAQEIDKRGLSLTMRRGSEEARAGQVNRDISSIGKFRWANMVKNEQDIAMDAAGTQSLGWEGPGFEANELERTRKWLATRSDSIWGGTNEIQLNIIAKRVLGLPE